MISRIVPLEFVIGCHLDFDENEWQISLILLSHNKENGANFKLDELTFGYMCIRARTSRGVIRQNKKRCQL